MLGVIPFLDSSSYDFDRRYRLAFPELSKAGAKHLVFQRTGPRKNSDLVYLGMRTPALVKKDKRDDLAWNRAVDCQEDGDFVRLGQMSEWSDTFGLDPTDIPCLVCVTPSGERVALFRISDGSYADDRCWRVFLRHFCEFVQSRELRDLATRSPGDPAASAKLQPMLDLLKEDIDRAILDIGKQCPDLSPNELSHTTVTEDGKRTVSQHEYEKIVETSGDLDIFINGVTRRAARRVGGAAPIEASLSRSELDMLGEYILKPGKSLRPIDTRAGNLCSSVAAACHMFEIARRKAECKQDGKYRSFLTESHPEGPERKTYKFLPDKNLRYCLILPA